MPLNLHIAVAAQKPPGSAADWNDVLNGFNECINQSATQKINLSKSAAGMHFFSRSVLAVTACIFAKQWSVSSDCGGGK